MAYGTDKVHYPGHGDEPAAPAHDAALAAVKEEAPVETASRSL
jgi:hypothetical protein